MSVVATLIVPLKYLRIKHPLKRWVDLVPPLVSTVAAVSVSWIKPDFNLFGGSGLITGIDGLLQSLVGFFITSLAAVATFQGGVFKIDNFFDGVEVTLGINKITRRQFLCYLFGYLAFTSLLIYLTGVVMIAFANTPHAPFGQNARQFYKAIFLVPYSAILGHMFGTTLLGLVFLAERLSAVADSDRFKLRQGPPKPD